MNKKIMTVAIAGSLAMSLSAFASSGPGASHHGSHEDNMDWSKGWYVGAGINGDATNTANLVGRDPAVFANGSNTAGGITAAPSEFEQTSNNIGFDVFVGRDVSRHFAFEVGYTWVGNVEFETEVTEDEVDEITVQQWNVHAVGVVKMPVGEYFTVFGKGGIAYLSSVHEISKNEDLPTAVNSDETLNTFALTAGAGMEVAWDQFGVRGEYNVLLPSETARNDFYISDVVSLNVFYKFM